MAVDPKGPEQQSGAAAPATATEPREIPSFSKVAGESRDARSAELAELAGVTPGKKTETTPEGAAPDFDAEWNKLPETFRTEVTSRFHDGYNRMLSEQYGDVLPLAIEANKNPNLRATLAAAAKDPELLTLLGDEKARDMLKDLTKAELREFLFGEAKSTYERYNTPADAARSRAEQKPSPAEERVAKLEESIATERFERDTDGYISERQREVQALTSAFPDLARPESRKQVEHIINVAEERFESAALQRGIKTRNADGSQRKAWPAEALRAGIKPQAYREIHEYYAEVLGRATPPAAPATSAATMGAAPAQAPRDAAEGKTRALTLLKNSGGLKGLASASSRRK